MHILFARQDGFQARCPLRHGRLLNGTWIRPTGVAFQADVADQIRRSEGQVELVDDQGNRVGVVRRPPTEDEIKYAKSRVRSAGPKFTVEEVIAKVEAL